VWVQPEEQIQQILPNTIPIYASDYLE
jgi:hypothetical protein